MEPIIVGISAFIAGAAVVKIAEKTGLSRKTEEAEEKRKSIIENATLEAKNIKQEALIQSQSEIESLRSKFEKERDLKQSDLDAVDKRLIAKESKLDQKFDSIEQREKSCERKTKELDNRVIELDQIESKQKSELERISKLSEEEAKEQLLKKIESNLEYEHAVKIKEYAQLFKEQATKKANWLLAEAMQRCTMEYTAEALVSVVTLPNDEMKGRIIGRDGRNIRAFENLTGIDVIVDDTPEAVVLSGFNAIKREIARMTMEKLIQDGRIHPAKIEQVIEQSQKELFDTIKEAGEQAVIDIGIHNIHEKLIIEIGKLKYRTSYGQNVLQHSLEVAKLAGIMANELGVNVKIARRAGLLHDIGKVSDSEVEGSHAMLGMQLAKKLGEKAEVCNAIGSHHEEIEASCIESVLVGLADALSASRPGARRETIESYIKRLEELETIAKNFPGVNHAYAIQAGREIRVLVKPNEVDDAMSAKLAHDIVQNIESELEYPGQVRVVVIRETRAVDVAR
jgi:ribonuclease Y